MQYLILGVFMVTSPLNASPQAIVALDNPRAEVLMKKTALISQEELALAQQVGEQLKEALLPLMPAAGLAAPQIGISQAVFVFSYDRTPENLQMAINPRFEPVGEETIEGWELCFSCKLSDGTIKAAKVTRYAKIKAFYLDSNGQPVEQLLDGFAAKVFQHEYDHLQGIVNINRPEAIVKTFENEEEGLAFMAQVKKEDSKTYRPPN